MKLWLDDIRPAPEGWHHVKTADEAIEALKTGAVEMCSLDHDLADEHYGISTGYMGEPVYRERTGYDVVLWMAEHNAWPNIVLVHSANPVGAARMRGVIARYKPAASGE